MKHLTLLIGFFLMTGQLFSQWNIEKKRNDRWYFSTMNRLNILDFSSASSTTLPVVDSTPVQNLLTVGNRSFINDINGNLLFYSNAAQLYDHSFQLMMNGDSITPNLYTAFCFANAVTILPKPNNDSLYYVFSVSSDTPGVILGGQYIYYSIVNVKANSGKGAVISKSNLLFTGSTSSGHLMPVRHGNGRDWWIIIKDCCGNNFYRFLLKPDTILSFPPQTIGLPYSVGDAWQATVSPAGNKLAIISSTGPFSHPLTDLSIYNFDRCTGALSDPVQYIHLRDDTLVKTFSVCFSPNEKYLYWLNSDTIFQYNLLTNSAIHVAVFDSTNIDSLYVSLGLQREFSFAAMQLGPDGRIFIGTHSEKLHYINHPDLPGAACDVHQNAIKCPSGFSTFLFNVPSFYMQPAWGSGCDTVTAVTHIEHEESIWLYPNPAHGFVNISFPEPGLKYKLIIQSAEGHIVYQAYFNRKSSPPQIAVSNLTPGLYFIELKDENGKSKRTKLIKE